MTQSGAAAEARYGGVRHALVRIAREEGPRALLRGIGPRVLWISMGGGIFIGTCEEVKRRLSAAGW